MPVTLEQVVVQLDREEPNYAQAARLGPEALPHLVTLIQGSDIGLAAKAASLAGLIDAPESVGVLERASRHPEAVVRVAAAAASRNLTTMPSALAIVMLNDPDPGVRKWVLKALEVHRPTGVKAQVEEISQNDPVVGLRDQAKGIVARLP